MINESRFRLKKDGTPNKKCFCQNPELIENYEVAVADTTQTWHCHHRLETHNSDGERRLVDLTKEELIALGIYFDRPPEELIFLTHSEHRSLHNKGKKIGPFSEEHKAKLSKAHKGKPSWNKGKEFSEDYKRKLSLSHKGKHLPEETRAKMSEARKGKHWHLVNGKRIYY